MAESSGAEPVVVLVVEDEALIQDIVVTVLQEGGFAVVTAKNAAEAIQLLDNDPLGFQALIADIRLGSGPNGWAVAKHGRELNPQLPVVYMSGDSGVDWAANGVPQSLMLQKPFAPAQIVTAVASLINQAPALPAP